MQDIYLEYLPYGGIFLFGGMVDPLIKHLKKYLQEYLKLDGKMSVLANYINVSALLNPHAVLDGCAHYLSGFENI